MKRREMLRRTGAAVLGLSAFPLGWAAGAQAKTPRLLYFTRCAGYLHSVVRREGEQLSFSEKVLTQMGKEHGIEVVCTKDGRVFDRDLSPFDVIAFYTSGDLTREVGEKTPPMTQGGKQRLLEAIAAGKGFVGFHAANDSFRGNPNDPFLLMLGGEFVSHGPQQKATMKVTSPNFPGIQGLGDSFEMLEEWYAMKNFTKDMHVILVQETAGMQGDCYQRPPYPATWARKQDKGRVFYTSLGHREDVWTSKIFQQIVLGGLSWVLGKVDADVTPNLQQVAPKAEQLHH